MSVVPDAPDQAIARMSLPALPEGWKWERFSSKCERVSVGHVGPTTKHFVEAGQGVTLIRSQNVRPGKLVLDGALEITTNFHAKLKKSQLKSGDVLIVRVGANRADCCVVPEDIGEINCANIVFARPYKNGDFFSYYFQSSFGRKMLLGSTTGAAQEVINTGSVADMPVPVPPAPVQRKIGDILGAYDALIENNRRRIALLEEAARLLYREWFVHFRFPGHEHVKIVDGIPEGWKSLNLGDLVLIKKGRNITKSNVEPGNVPVVAGGLNPAYFHSKANTCGPVITVSASGANAGFVNIYHMDVWASDCSYIDSKSTPYTYYYYLAMRERQQQITSMQVGAAQPHVYPKDLARLEITHCDSATLDAFSSLIEPNFLQIKNLLAMNEQLAKARDLLLPRLMDGRLEVAA